MFLIFFSSAFIYSQDTDTPVDSLNLTSIESKDTLSKKEKRKYQRELNDHSPKKALLFSVGLPGAGQVYNRHYWKLPIVYGALGGMTYLVITNTQELKRFRTAYLHRVDGDPDTVDEFVGIYTDSGLASLRDQALGNVELSYIGLSLAYILTAVDAFVGAHLKTFDINDDLSLGIQPGLMQVGYGGPAVGLSAKLYLK